MTNTKITDPETFERRYPVILHEFSIREGSGGKGRFNGESSGTLPYTLTCAESFSWIGGNGVIRDVEFVEPIQCSILSERRVYRPFGLSGGGDAQCGKNVWMKLPRKEDGDLIDGKDPKAYRSINVSGKQTVRLGKGDRFVINTPGGGAWGQKEEEKVNGSSSGTSTPNAWHRGSARGSWADRKAHAEGV
jgi:N-methylhydantoinase B/oxoprolinase/acetone carboxylase alpha subunit